MKRPFFSICIAAYNAQSYIGECLNSIAAQDCCDYEVVIVDDGSDQPLLLDKNMRELLPSCILRRTANRGPYAARQKAFEIASGEVFLCIDADDGLRDFRALSKVKMAFESNADVVLFNASISDHDPVCMFDYSSLGGDGEVKDRVIWDLFSTSYSLNSMCCKAFKRGLYRKPNEIRPRLLMAEDRLQSLEIMRHARIFRLINEPLYYYRPNPASTTNSNYDPAYFRQACYVEEKVIEYMQGCNMALGEWASYFLEYTSMALLGIRYNCKLSASMRRSAYASVQKEHILDVARKLCPDNSISRIDRLRLNLLETGCYWALDMSMLPWRIGSIIKRVIRTA